MQSHNYHPAGETEHYQHPRNSLFVMLFLLLVEIMCNFVIKALVKVFLKSLSPAYQVLSLGYLLVASVTLIAYNRDQCPFPGLSTGYYYYVKKLKRDETTGHHARRTGKHPVWAGQGDQQFVQLFLNAGHCGDVLARQSPTAAARGFLSKVYFCSLVCFFNPPHPTLPPCSCLLFSKKPLSHRSPQPWKPLWVKLEGDVTFQR